MDKLLEVKQLTKVFSLGNMLSRVRITAVDNVSFNIKRDIINRRDTYPREHIPQGEKLGQLFNFEEFIHVLHL